MNAHQQEVHHAEVPETETSQTEAPQTAVPPMEASQRRIIQQQLVEAQDAYWTHVTRLSAMVGRIQRFGQQLFGVENLEVTDAEGLPDKAELLTAIQQKETGAQEIARLNALLGVGPDTRETGEAKIVRLWP